MSSKQGCTFGDKVWTEQFHFETKPSIGQIQSENNKPDVQSKDLIGSNQQLYKDIMYGSRPSDYQSLLYENKIQLLQDRLQCYQEEIQNLKKTNAILNMNADKISQLEKQLEDKNDQIFELRDLICAHQDKNQELRRQNQDRVAFFKQKLEEMSQNAEQIKLEQQKIISRQKDEITTLKENLSNMATKLSHYERKVHFLQIQRLNSEQDETERDSIFHQRNSMASRFSSQNSENVNSMNLEKSRVSVEEKARQFMRRDQNELKIMMKSLSTAQKCLQMGGQELSMIGMEKEEKSEMEASRMTKSKFNKTYFK